MAAKKKKRQCTGKTKRGTRCKARPLKDHETCLAHSDEKTRDSVGFGGPQEGAGRPRHPRAIELMRKRAEDEAEAILAPYFDQIQNAVVIVKYQGEAIVTDIPDTAARMDASERLFDRIDGKPVLRTEVTGPEGTPVQLEHEFRDPKTRKALNDLVDRVGAARASKSSGRSISD